MTAICRVGGLAMGALHGVVSGGPDVETAAAAALLIAGILARRSRPVLWVQERPDLFHMPPGHAPR